MKKQLLLLAILISSCGFVTAQDITKPGDDYYMDYNNIQLPESPNAASLGNFGNVPVDPSTGVANISIPIHTLEVDGFKLPVAISYNTSGVKVDELSSAVGLKWALSAGGSISRTIQNKPDEDGWLTSNLSSLPDDWYGQQQNTNLWQTAMNSKARIHDHNPDLFNYSFAGYSGQFIVDKNSQVVKQREDGLEIDYSPSDFTIADQKGVTYYFNTAKETSSGYNLQTTLPEGGLAQIGQVDWQPHTSGWMLSKIVTKNNKEISFTYEEYEVGYTINQASHSLTWSVACNYTTNPSTDYELQRTATQNVFEYTTQLIKTITSDNIQIVFDYNTDTALSDWQKKLTKVTINDLVTGNKKEFRLVHGTFGGDPRLKLQEIYPVGNDNSPLPGHKFHYNTGNLPTKGSFAKDFFGYYNGTSGNSSLVPHTPSLEAAFPGHLQYIENNTGDRSLGAASIQRGILHTVEYPTGGKTELAYAPNKEGNKYSGGLRVESVISKDTEGSILLEKQYLYSGLVGSDMETLVLAGFTDKEDGWSRSFHSSFVARPDLDASGHYYGTTEVITKDGGDQYKEVYVHGEDYTFYPFGKYEGLLTEKKAYKNNDLISIEEYEYQWQGDSQTVEWNILSDRVCIQGAGGNGYVYYLGYTDGITLSYTGNRAKLPVQVAVTEFLSHGGTALYPVTTVTSYTYNDRLLKTQQVVDYQKSRLDSVGTVSYPLNDNREEVITIDLTYPEDYPAEPSLQGLPVGLPVSQAVHSANRGGTIYGQFFEYDGSGNIKKTFRYNKGQGNNNSPLGYIPSNYEEMSAFVFSDGNPVQVKPFTGAPTAYLWAYNGQYPAAKIENMAYGNIPSGLVNAVENASNATQLQSALNNLRNDPALGNAMTTTYIHKPLAGVLSMTDPKGDRTSFVYDAFGRLELAKDKQGRLLQEKEYHYLQGGVGNYVKEILYKTPTTSPKGSPSGGDATQLITYMDGLGRPIQQIAHRQSGNGNDLVTHIEYDGYGRQVKEYLPYERTAASLSFAPTAKSETIAFYDSEYGSSYAYSEKELENSPLGRVLRQAAPGDDWAMDNGHEIKFDYETNHQNEVYYFKVNNPTGTPSLALNSGNGGKYGANQLYKTVTKDENWQSGDGVKGTVVEFKDKLGRVVLKRHYNVEPVEGMVVEDAVPYDTYYIYDDYGNLTFVLPPKLSKQIVNGSSLVGNRQHLLNELGYRYRYDHRNRVSAKKIPGKRWEYLVYDQLDRLRATGPVHSPFQEDDDLGWLVYKYDRFDRPVMTLWMRDSLLEDAESEAIHSFRRSVNDQTVLSEYRVRERLIEKGIFFFYSKQTYPIADFDILAVYYYDTYDDFDQALNDFPASVPSTVLGQPVGYNNSNPPVGMPTGSWVRVLESDSDTNANTSYTFYDDKGRALRTHTDNYLGGHTRMDREFDFTGKVLKSVTSHQLDTNANPTQVEEVFTYTDQERPVRHSHRIGTQNAELLSHSSYDALGQLTAKRVGGDPETAAGLQVVDYSYNIRGWLTGINNISNLLASGQPQDLFAFRIRYNNAIESTEEVQSLYNGNIAQVDWRTSVDNVLRRYSYGYDRLNRLTEAWYQVPGTGVNHSYDEYLAYDRNGNITALERYGEIESASTLEKIDNLVYDYDYDDGNRLINVTDGARHPAGFDDGNIHNESGNDDFEYDAFGNLVIDRNKDITSVSYNHLNLPKKVVFHEGESEILYLYDANGVKMEKITKQEHQVIKKVNYQGVFQYTDGVMDFIHTAEGYTKVTHSEENIPHYNYVFNYTDHLGNVRVSWTQNPEAPEELVIIDDNHYYPFGLRHKGYQSHPQVHYWATSFQQVALTTVSSLYPESYKYKFNGMEYQSEMDINLYDFGMRNYDPTIGRWMNIDPLAEVYSPISPYVYAANNPIRFVDYDGEDFGVKVDHDKNTIVLSANLYFESSEDLSKNIDAILQWANAEGTYENSDGEEYSVSFEISGKVAEPGSDAEKEAKKDRIGNFVKESSDNDFDNAYKEKGGKEKLENLGGFTFNNKYIYNKSSVANDQTRAHEIGHLFGLGENSGGVMDYKESFSSMLNVTKSNISKVISNTLNELQRIKKGRNRKLPLRQTDRSGYTSGNYSGNKGFFKTKFLTNGIKVNKP